MHCDKDHHREFAALKDLDLPASQRMEVRHTCAACAMEAGFSRGYRLAVQRVSDAMAVPVGEILDELAGLRGE